VDSLDRGDVKPAINQLGAFINETGALVRRGTPQEHLATATTMYREIEWNHRVRGMRQRAHPVSVRRDVKDH